MINVVCLMEKIYTVYIYIYLLSGQVLDIVKNLTTELRLASLNNILSTLVEEIYILHEKETWAEDIRYGTKLDSAVLCLWSQSRSESAAHRCLF